MLQPSPAAVPPGRAAGPPGCDESVMQDADNPSGPFEQASTVWRVCQRFPPQRPPTVSANLKYLVHLLHLADGAGCEPCVS